MRKKLKNLFHILSMVIIVNFFRYIFGSIELILSNCYLRYKMYRLIVWAVRNSLNEIAFPVITWTCCLYVGLLTGIFLVKKFGFLFTGNVFRVNIKDRDKLIRLTFSVVFSLIFLIYDGWLINHWFLFHKAIAIKIFVNIIILPITILLCLLLVQARWEKFWRIILKVKKPFLKTVHIVTIIILALILILNVFIYLDRKINIPKGPNIILISIDTLRADHLGCYGYGRNTSPAIDSFSKDSVLFDQCISQAPYTTASHASMFTSLIPVHHGLLNLADGFTTSVLTISEILKNNFHNTISFNNGGYVSGIFGFDRGFDKYESSIDGLANIDLKYQYFNVQVDKLKGWIGKNYTKDIPCFIFLHTYEVHTPYSPSKEFLNLIESNYNGKLPNEINYHKHCKKINKGDLEIDKSDLEHIISLYDAEIMSMDESFSSLMDFLKKENIYDDSLIILTSDHGEEFGEHGKVGEHGHTLYDDQLKVPLIIKFPHSKWKGKVVKQQVRSIDILPTILDWLEFEQLVYFEGVSLFPLIKEENIDEELYAVSQRTYADSSIRTNNWKWYNEMLFDLKNDPGEKYDISQANREVAEFLKTELEEIINSRNIIFWDKETKKIEITDDLKEQLKSLGYL